MLRVRDGLIKKMYKTDLSKFELITLIEIIKIADTSGEAHIYYKDIAEMVGCSEAGFYNCLKKLEEHELIERCKNDEYKREMIVAVNNNSFSDGTIQSGYIKLNNKFFCNSRYKELKAGEIRCMLYLLFRTAKGAYSGDIESPRHDKNKTYYKESSKSIAKSLHMKKRMVKEYLDGLLAKKFISFGEQKVKKCRRLYDVITVAHALLSEQTITATERGQVKQKKITELQPHFVHAIKNFCRRLKKEVPDDLILNDTAELLPQYKREAERRGKDIYELVQSAIKSLNDKVLNSKTVHNILKAIIERESVLVNY
ncbi:MAG: hypothetical protein SOV35_03950 [Clostridium sp.]|nr:hypothetical protein [Clostridium sp.]